MFVLVGSAFSVLLIVDAFIGGKGTLQQIASGTIAIALPLIPYIILRSAQIVFDGSSCQPKREKTQKPLNE